jgi:hypothetical protein
MENISYRDSIKKYPVPVVYRFLYNKIMAAPREERVNEANAWLEAAREETNSNNENYRIKAGQLFTLITKFDTPARPVPIIFSPSRSPSRSLNRSRSRSPVRRQIPISAVPSRRPTGRLSRSPSPVRSPHAPPPVQRPRASQANTGRARGINFSPSPPSRGGKKYRTRKQKKHRKHTHKKHRN